MSTPTTTTNHLASLAAALHSGDREALAGPDAAAVASLDGPERDVPPRGPHADGPAEAEAAVVPMSPTEARPVPTQPGLSDADNEAHALSTYVRRRVVEPELVELPPLPVQPAARRRAIASRKW